MRRGWFITFEGPEGAGKSSQIQLLGAALTASGREVVITREPGGTPLAEAIRDVVKGHQGAEAVHPVTELLLMEAARSQHVSQVVIPALAAGKIVLCDRFFDSTTAYQGGGRGLDIDMIIGLNRFASQGVIPDLTLLLDLAPERGFERTGRRAETQGEYDRFELEKLDFHRRVRQIFLALAEKEPHRVKVVDADRDQAAVQRDVRKLVDELVC
jgi:dTMP kinase